MMPSKGDTLKKEGIDLALSNEKEEWLIKAVLLMQGYCQTHEEFMGEDVNQWCMAQGLEPPHHPNVWGAVFRTALLKSGEERVRIISYAKAKSAKSHSHVFPIYRSLSYPVLTHDGVIMNAREQIAQLKTQLKFKEISIDDFTEIMWGLMCTTNTKVKFLEY